MSGMEIVHALSLLIWLRLYAVRSEMRRLRVHPQFLATPAQKPVRLIDTRASANFSKLFEVPRLIHPGVVMAYLTRQAAPLVFGLARIFAAGRLLHSRIQRGYNKVLHRFTGYSLSTCVGGVRAVGVLRG